jgi:alanine racemase
MKYIRVYAEIDLNAIRHNFETVKKRTGGKVLAVIKANAYGHGAVRVANEIKDLADYFAVATIEEAVELRENSIDTPYLYWDICHRSISPSLLNTI